MIPPEFLQLRLADVLTVHSTVDQRRPVPLRRVVAALRRLERQIERDDRARAAADRAWLAKQFEELSP